MIVSVDVDGSASEVDISLEHFTLQELVKLENLLGGEAFDRFAEGERRPSTLQAMLYVKLAPQVPGIAIDDFDFDLSALADMGDDTESDTAGTVLEMPIQIVGSDETETVTIGGETEMGKV